MSVATVITAFSPPHFHHLHASTKLPSQHTFSNYNASAKSSCLRNNAAGGAASMMPHELGYGLKHRRRLVRRDLTWVGAEHKTVNDVLTDQFLLENEEQNFTPSFVEDESLEPFTSSIPTPSVDDAVADSDTPASLDCGQVQPNSPHFIDSSRFSYLKSISSGHWELINNFLDQEPDEDRRFELREAGISLMSTINNVRFILHDKYYVGERLEADDIEIVRKLLLYHPKVVEKLGCGLDYIKIDRHPKYECRCFFVVRKDGSCIDFSFRKCILELGEQILGLGITKRLLDFKF